MADPAAPHASGRNIDAEAQTASPASGHSIDTEAQTAASPVSGQYFEAQPQAAAAPRSIVVSIGDMELPFETDSGVFSPDRLDAGTRLLLQQAPPLGADDRRVLDLGCGWGPIACIAGLRSPCAEVLAVDVNERARRLTQRNASSLGATNVTVAHPDDVDPALSFDRILCNPPIRIGKPALHELLARWLDRLADGGRAHLVVHRHLGSDSLALWLKQRERRVSRLASRSGYRVLEVIPRTAESR